MIILFARGISLSLVDIAPSGLGLLAWDEQPWRSLILARYCFTPSRSNCLLVRKISYTRAPALGGEAVILFERDEQKDKSGSADPAFLQGNAQKINQTYFNLKKLPVTWINRIGDYLIKGLYFRLVFQHFKMFRYGGFIVALGRTRLAIFRRTFKSFFNGFFYQGL